VAQALHRASARAGELVSVNCAALPRELIESELFGYVSGAFSGARASRQGLFRTASGGTLFLDEVAEMPLEAQAKLLRVLEEGEVRAVGADRSVAVDVRVISATHQRLDALAVAGRFREDLFHRLAVLRIGVPPLRDRPDDALLLARRFLGDTDVTLSAGAAEALALAAWPGNVRELRNVIQRALVCVQDEGRKKIGRADLGRLARKSSRAEPKPRSAPADSEVLRARIETALKLRQGNVTQVAKDLEMHRGRLYEAFVRLAIDPEAFRDK
jgi:two-component system response regulator GlrR